MTWLKAVPGSVFLQKQAKHKLAAVQGIHHHPNTLLYVRAFAWIQISYSFPVIFNIRFNYAGVLLQQVYQSEHALENTEWCSHICKVSNFIQKTVALKKLSGPTNDLQDPPHWHQVFQIDLLHLLQDLKGQCSSHPQNVFWSLKDP